ncbi:MAG: ribosomal biogenesis protein [Methanomassiliicoccales archaeon]|jgi:nucleolar protein 56
MILVTKWFGVFLCDEQRVRKHLLFEKDPKAIAQKLAAIQRGEILPEERQLAQKRMKVADARLSRLGKPIVFDSSFIKAEDHSFSADLMHETMVELGKVRTREPLRPDKCIAQAIRAEDDLIETTNIMNERLHEWYGLHFPELADYAKDDAYARAIAGDGERTRILKNMNIDLESVGAELLPEDIEVLTTFAASLSNLYTMKDDLDRYIAERMKEVAPSLTTLAGATLGARLISLAGGLGRLSQLPSSTVQLLGAEKAMFLHLRSGKRPPKHGIIFLHPSIHRAPYWMRGKIARALASKASIASKVDYWHGQYIGDKLLDELVMRIEEIKDKYPEPPRRPEIRRRQ